MIQIRMILIVRMNVEYKQTNGRNQTTVWVLFEWRNLEWEQSQFIRLYNQPALSNFNCKWCRLLRPYNTPVNCSSSSFLMEINYHIILYFWWQVFFSYSIFVQNILLKCIQILQKSGENHIIERRIYKKNLLILHSRPVQWSWQLHFPLSTSKSPWEEQSGRHCINTEFLRSQFRPIHPISQMHCAFWQIPWPEHFLSKQSPKKWWQLYLYLQFNE